MKKQIVLITAMVLAQAAIAATGPLEDRVEFAPGVYGITHTENFEYVCNMKSKQDGAEAKMFLDIDSSEKPGYRLASGFPGGGTVMGVVAAEAKVISVTKARCPGLCLLLTIESNEGDKASVQFTEDPISHAKTAVVTDLATKQVSETGLCQANEVE